MRIAPHIELTDDERVLLQQWARGRRTPVRLALRAKMMLLAADGQENRHIAAAVGTSRQTVGLWRERFAAHRVAGIARDAPRGGRPPQRRQALQAHILKTTTQTRPPSALKRSFRCSSMSSGSWSPLRWAPLQLSCRTLLCGV